MRPRFSLSITISTIIVVAALWYFQQITAAVVVICTGVILQVLDVIERRIMRLMRKHGIDPNRDDE